MFPLSIVCEEKSSSRTTVAFQLRKLSLDRCSTSSVASSRTSTQRSSSLSECSRAAVELPIKGYLPPNVVEIIVRHADPEDLRALHRVSHTWREAVCRQTLNLTPATCNLAMLKRFPKVQAIGMGEATFVEPELAHLQNLQTLMLHDCTFMHSLKELTCLSGLECCRLKDIRCKGGADMDAFLNSLTNLTRLEVLRTRAQSSLPTCRSLASFPKLQALVITDARQQMQLTMLTQLSGLTEMRELSLSKVGVGPVVLQAMSSLFQLQSLELHECYKLTNQALPSLAHLTGLTRLDLRAKVLPREEDLSADGIAHLSELTKLRELNLAGHCRLTSSALSFLSSFTDLQELSLAGTQLGEGAPFLALLEALQKLDLSKTKLAVAEGGFQAWGSLRRLTELNLSETEVDDDSAPEIAKLQHLETLDISYSKTSGKGLLEIVHGCPALTVLSADGCPVSVLSMRAAILHRPELRFWQLGNPYYPTWASKLETVLMAHCAPSDRRPRACHCREETKMATAGVSLVTLLFFLLYFVIIPPCFIIMMVPLGALSILYIAANVLAGLLKPLAKSARRGSAALVSLTKPWRVGAPAAAPPEPVADMV